MRPQPGLDLIQAALRRALFDPQLEVESWMTSADIDGWDSLAHVRLLLEIERLLGTHFLGDEGTRARSIGELAELIAAKAEKNGLDTGSRRQ